MLESLFNIVAVLKACNFIKNRLQHRSFAVKFALYLKRPILNIICERLLFSKGISRNTLQLHAFFIGDTFISKARLKLAKNKQMLKNTLRLNLCYLKILHILHSRCPPTIIGHILKNKQKNKCVCFLEIVRLIVMKMKMKMKNRSHK